VPPLRYTLLSVRRPSLDPPLRAAPAWLLP
jgi:hypothetical protein